MRFPACGPIGCKPSDLNKDPALGRGALYGAPRVSFPPAPISRRRGKPRAFKNVICIRSMRENTSENG